jgi:hypothetical protein
MGSRTTYGLANIPHEEFTCPNGNEMYLPSTMKLKICCGCLTPVVSPDSSDTDIQAARRYMARGWIQMEAGAVRNRPVCQKCAGKRGGRRG